MIIKFAREQAFSSHFPDEFFSKAIPDRWCVQPNGLFYARFILSFITFCFNIQCSAMLKLSAIAAIDTAHQIHNNNFRSSIGDRMARAHRLPYFMKLNKKILCKMLNVLHNNIHNDNISIFPYPIDPNSMHSA